ncbi:DUF2125 domain-containing protein [Roseovarius salinarum]|uniref:DUF2125 domain-containing protein n=1 Tax=Roseovarius salinarum TaxID=1981892 RepID=UPI000C3488A5|nr:DUF2125 domain-containing protein [Roseovarius salinarum]
MKRLLIVILVAAAGWSAYWLIGANQLRAAYAGWFEARRAEGWAADYGTLEVNGFPNRFDTGFTDLALADPDTGLAWEAPFFQIMKLSYRPNHVIAAWPERQLVATPRRKYHLQSRDMRASMIFEPETRLRVRRATLTAEALETAPQDMDAPTRMEALTLAAERVPADDEASYRLGLSADGLAPPLPWRRRIDPAGSLPERFDAFSADLTVTFDKPWDRSAVEDARPQPRRIKIALAEARWGRLELQAAGRLQVDAGGVPEGSVTVKARNWREILEMAESGGVLSEGMAETLRDGLGVVAQLAGNPRTLDVPLTFAGGRVKLGPVPLGRAPRLRLR